MKYKDIITLNKNSRGCYILDTVKGCSYSGEHPGGCYGECYAANIAKRYGFDFCNVVARKFSQDGRQLYLPGFCDTRHEDKIISEIAKADMPFVRIGEMGDPSEDWEHTVNICKAISRAGKQIVIITKHWNKISRGQLCGLGKIGVTINTSVSAMDTEAQLSHRLFMHSAAGEYCNAVLRVVSCDFADEKMAEIQNELLGYRKIIETIFRPSANNPLVVSGKMRTEVLQFLRKKVIVSRRDKNIYFGMCDTCPDMCGILK